MSLIPWKGKQRDGDEPASGLGSLRDEVDRLFGAYVREPLHAIDWPFGGGPWAPAVDIVENADEVVVRAEVPGVEPSDIEVTITGNQLVLSGEKRQAKEAQDKGVFRSEIRTGGFRRSVALPAGLDSENVDAQCAHGVLTLRLKKTRAAKAKRIDVKKVE